MGARDKKNKPQAKPADIGDVVALRRAGRLTEAEAAARRLLVREPRHPVAWEQLGQVLEALGRAGEAEAAMRHALDFATDPFDALNNLAALLARRGAMTEAADLLEKALKLRPDNAFALSNRGGVYRRLGNLEQAVTLLERAIAVAPSHPTAHANLGVSLAAQGQIEAALVALRRAVALAPGDMVNHDNLLLNLHYSSETSPEAVAEAHAVYGRAALEAAARRPAPRTRDLARDRPLRVGLVSPDLKRHSVAFFIEPLLEGRNRDELQVFAYSNTSREDEVSARLKALCDEWHDISTMSDSAVVEMVRAHQVDILIDLAGHTAGNRLGVFAERGAPVQMTYLGYPDTTGLPTVEYRITDVWSDPPGAHDAAHTERLLYMEDGFLCYRPSSPSPEVATPPTSRGEPLTFGSFNASKKVSDKTLELWRRVLEAAPGSRLLLKDLALGDPSTRSRFERRLEAHGLPLERVRLVGYVADAYGHLDAYQHIDVALDTYPYHGTTTTCDALWMGLPVVTLAGPSHVSRVGVGLLERVGLGELVASTEDDYVALAVALGGDPERLRELRASARARLASSTLLDGSRMAAAFARALRRAWHEHVDRALGEEPASSSVEEVPAATVSEPTRPDAGSRWQWLPGRIRIATPDTFSQMTTYVLEEQGDWFEAELHFVRTLLRGGESVLDVGANHGVYALSMAREVGPGGRVLAIEPAGETAARLRASASENGFSQLHVLQCAISDHEGTAVLHTGSSSELSTLGAASHAARGSESVRLTTLDACVAEHRWTDIAFVKMDVEGEEIRALEGARGLLERDEPLWMVEYKHGGQVNHGLLEWLATTGHSLFRHVPGLDILVPHPPGTEADGYLLNVFAARPRRAAQLEAAGLLAQRIAREDEVPDAPHWSHAPCHVAAWSRLGDTSSFGESTGAQARHRMSLERYGLSQQRHLSPSVRAQCLQSALDLAASSIDGPEELGRLMTVARLAASWGHRELALEVLQTAIVVLDGGQARLSEPFLPACPRFDEVDPSARLGPWALACLLEQRERLAAFSSYFTASQPQTRQALETIAELGFQGPEMARRLQLVRRQARMTGR